MNGAKRPRRGRILVAVLVLLVLTGGGLGFHRLRRAQAAVSLPTIPVRKGDFAVVVRCRGELKAGRSVQLIAPRNVPDLKILWQVEPGAAVKSGQAVVRFDPGSAKRQLDEYLAVQRQAQASLDQALAQARTTAEQDKLDLANTRYQVERAKLEVSKQAIVSVIQGEESKIDLATAEAKHRVQEAAVDLHGKSDEAKIASVTRQLEKAKADVALTNERLAQMEMKAPIDGAISYSTNFSQGWMNARPFKVGDSVWPGATVAQIPDPATLQMEGKVEEIDRGRILVGNDALVRLDALPERVINGKLSAISLLTEMTYEWPPIRSFIAYARIENPDSRLRPGMNGAVDIVIRRIPDALSVPAKAVFTRSGKAVVYVAEPKRYRPVEVEVLARNPDEIALKGAIAGATVALAEPPLDSGGPLP